MPESASQIPMAFEQPDGARCEGRGVAGLGGDQLEEGLAVCLAIVLTGDLEAISSQASSRSTRRREKANHTAGLNQWMAWRTDITQFSAMS